MLVVFPTNAALKLSLKAGCACTSAYLSFIMCIEVISGILSLIPSKLIIKLQ